MALLAAVRLVVDARLPAKLQPPIHFATAVCVLGVARAAGATASDLGVEPRRLGRGVLLGVAVGGVAAGVVSAAGRHDRLSPRLAERGSDEHSHREAAFEAAVRIPVNTALYEELVFRSALLGLALEVVPPVAAVGMTSALFGLWHLPHVVALPGSVGPVEEATAGGLATVGVTAVGGVLFSVLRLTSGSVAAPVALHALVNSSAFLAARSANARHCADSG